jgi:hypothetical protein
MTDHVEMTITEGLKRLKLIGKRMVRNRTDLNKYASLVSSEKPFFDNEDVQRKEVAKLIQANCDLETEYCRIKGMVDYTNLVTPVTINDETRTIHSWLCVLRKTGDQMIDTFKSLNSLSAQSRITRYRSDSDSKQQHVIRLYDENEKRNGQRKWEDLTNGEIEGRLEVINATTQLLSPPEITI